MGALRGLGLERRIRNERHGAATFSAADLPPDVIRARMIFLGALALHRPHGRVAGRRSGVLMNMRDAPAAPRDGQSRNRSFRAAPLAAPPSTGKVPFRAISSAAARKPAHADRATAPPTLIRRRPRALNSSTLVTPLLTSSS